MTAPAQDLIECPRCDGSGEVWGNRTWNLDPQFDEPHRCPMCLGLCVVPREEVEHAREAEREMWEHLERAA